MVSVKQKKQKKKQYINEQLTELSRTFLEQSQSGKETLASIRKKHDKRLFRSKKPEWIKDNIEELLQTLSDTCSFNKLKSLRLLYDWYADSYGEDKEKRYQILNLFMSLRENVLETGRKRKFKALKQLIVRVEKKEEMIEYTYERTGDELEWRQIVAMEEEDSLSEWSDSLDERSALNKLSSNKSGERQDSEMYKNENLDPSFYLSPEKTPKIRLIANDLRNQGRTQQISELTSALLGVPLSLTQTFHPQILSYGRKYTLLDNYIHRHREENFREQISVRNFFHGLDKWLLQYQMKIRKFRHENIRDLSDLRLLLHLKQDFQFLDFILDVLLQPFLNAETIETHQLLTHLDTLLITETFNACSPESDFLIRLFLDSLTPYLQNFDAWMTNGKILSDSEFFIKDGNPHLEEHSDFSFHWARIPSFFRSIAPQILSTGKCLHVIHSMEIKNHVAPNQSFFSRPFVDSASEVRQKVEAYLDCDLERQLSVKYKASLSCGIFGSYIIDTSPQQKSVDFGFDVLDFESPLNINHEQDPESKNFEPSFAFVPLEQLLHQTLQTIVLKRYSETNASLYEIVNITPHLVSVRSFFCMEAGDLAITFSSGLFQILQEQDFTSILSDLVQEKLISCLESSSQAELFESRRYRFSLEDTNKKLNSITVLESFKFDYEVAWPLSELISTRVKQSYNDIFIFLLQCRRAQFELTTCTRGHRKNDTLDVIHRFYVLRQQILHMMSRLWDHITREVRFADWNALQFLLKEGASLTKLESTHNDLLTSIKSKLFLHGPWARAKVFILSMLSIACELSRLWERKILLFVREYDTLDKLNAWTQLNKFPQQRSEWTQTMAILHQRVLKFEKLREGCLESLKTIEHNFQRQHRICLTMLKQVLGKTFRPEVEFLLLTLNFNQYHTQQPKQPRIERPKFNFKF